MKINKTQKEAITKNIHKINEMDSSKLNLFTRELFIAKPQIDRVVFEWTLKACDIQAKSFKNNVSAMAVLSEFRGDDLK
ncbi:MAG: hypothetical protein KAS26_03065 [Sulfurimonas sp.]|nr:hypothetical protein [Sulfurimonas sp.]